MAKNFLTVAFSAAVFFAAFLSGCSHYRLAGTAVDLPFSSVYVVPVRNESDAAQASALLTNAISFSISQTPELSIASEGEAQARLETKLVGYRRSGVATRPDDTALAASYRVTAVARCTLTRSNGDVIFKDRKVEASVFVYPDATNGLIGAEYQNMPVLMRELGGKIKDAVIGIW